MSKFRAGMIGAGNICEFHVAAVKKLAPDLTTAVDARVKYWTDGLTSNATTPPAENAASNAANATLAAATKSAC